MNAIEAFEDYVAASRAAWRTYIAYQRLEASEADVQRANAVEARAEDRIRSLIGNSVAVA